MKASYMFIQKKKQQEKDPVYTGFVVMPTFISLKMSSLIQWIEI